MANKITATFKEAKEYTLNINEMRGADLTNSPLFASQKRATNIRNFIMENSVIQKRFGWREQHQLSGKINGYWEIDIRVSGEITKHIIVMSGKKFYILDKLSDSEETIATEIPKHNLVDDSKIIDDLATGVVGDEKLYILCGDFLTIGYYDGVLGVHRVENDSATFIPTTTIGITCNANTTSAKRTPYDDINMLSKWRYNKLLGEPSNTEIEEFKYVLDGVCTDLNSVEVRANGTLLTKTTHYTIENTTYEGINVTMLTLLQNYVPDVIGADNIEVKFEVEVEGQADKINKCKIATMYGYDNILDRIFVSGNSNYPNMIYRSTESTGNEQQDFTYFSASEYIKCGNTTNEIKGMKILGDGTLGVLKTPSGQEPTLYVITPKMITASDREGNVIYVDGEAQIEEAYIVQVGTIGEGLVNTSTLQNLCGDTLMLSFNGVFGVVLGNNVATSQRYSKARSRLINGELTKYSNTELENARAIVFENKYYLSVGDSGKVYVADGRHPFKLEDDLDNDFQYEWYVFENCPVRMWFIHDNKLYFGTDSGHLMCFENKNYRDLSYLTLGVGEITYDSEDEIFTVSKPKLNAIECLHNGDELVIGTSETQLYGEFLTENDFECAEGDSTKLIITKDIASDIVINVAMLDIYVDSLVGTTSEFVVNTPYTMSVDNSDEEKIICSFYTKGTTPEIVDLGNGKFRICYKLPQHAIIGDVKGSPTSSDEIIEYKNVRLEDNEYVIYNESGMIETSYSKENLIFNQFKLVIGSNNESYHKITSYNSVAPSDLSCSLEISQNVDALYITPIFNLGSYTNLKNLKKLIIVPDTMLGTEVDFGYETAKKLQTFNVANGKGLDFDNLDFDHLNFDTENFASGYTKKARAKNFLFIRFIFSNSTNTSCKISNLTAVYTIGKETKGVN